MLMLSVNLVILFFQLVLSLNCPFCANIKRECENQENVLSMDCGSFEIDGKPAKSYWEEPLYQESFLDPIQESKDMEGNTMTCIVVDYHFIEKPIEDGNSTTPEPSQRNTTYEEPKNETNTTSEPYEPQYDPSRTTTFQPINIDDNIIEEDDKYTLKTCMFQNKDGPACQLINDYTELSKYTIIKIDKCDVISPTNDSKAARGKSARVLASGRLIVFIMSMVSLKMFI